MLTYFKSKDYDRCKRVIEKSINGYGTNIEGRCSQIGLCYMMHIQSLWGKIHNQNMDYPRAIQIYNNIITKALNIHKIMDQNQDSIFNYQDLLSSKISLGECYMLSKRIPDAIRVFEKAAQEIEQHDLVKNKIMYVNN